MACCGATRQHLVAAMAPAARREQRPPAPPPATRRAPVSSRIWAEYIGRTALTVRGPVSGRLYRFEGPGARLEIDPRDRPGLAAVSHLRQLVSNAA